MNYKHIPVMLEEAIEYLDVKPGGFYVDCTLGGGGYTFEITKKTGERGKVLSFDMDDLAIDNVKLRIKEDNINNVYIVKSNFRNLQKVINEHKEFKNKKIDGVVFDLGLSSAQLDDGTRGISFKHNASLNMSFGSVNDNSGKKTERIINKWKYKTLVKILKDYGEERYAVSIAKAIVERRRAKRIKTTKELLTVIERAVPKKYRHGKIHFATKTFQALRIATNDELGSLEEVLPQAIDILAPGGRCVVISYHSLEDRMVKRYFRREAKNCICDRGEVLCSCQHEKRIKLINKKIITPTDDELLRNNRSRSAKMRVIEKI